jgi:predicted short-subunit dehydrogenase-like oxidoreductase (DUF2520 family)
LHLSDHKSAIAVIGTGNIARSLGRLLHKTGADIVQAVGRSIDTAREAAEFIGEGVAAGTFRELNPRADHLIVAVADHALSQVVIEIVGAGFASGVVLHTSGGSGLNALQPLREQGTAVGVLHPLQSVPSPAQGLNSLPGSFFALAGDPAAVSWAASLVALLRGRPIRINADHWALYHAAAVMASNYQVTLLDSALELFAQAGVPSDIALEALAPIVRATAENVLLSGPAAALTGPIQRGDAETVRAHLRTLISASPETRQAYVALGLRTVPIAVRSGLPSAEAACVQAALEAAQTEIAK